MLLLETQLNMNQESRSQSAESEPIFGVNYHCSSRDGRNKSRAPALLPRVLAVLAVVAAALPGCSRGPATAAPGQRPGGEAVVPVTVVTAKQQDVPVQLSAIGSVRAYASVSIKARVDGALARVAFKQGDEVKQGDPIFQIDPRPFQAALDQAQSVLERDQASLENAQTDMRRTDALEGTKAVSASVVDSNRSKAASIRATVAADQAALESARLNLSFCSITAPITGRIGLLLVDEGNMVKNNDTVLAIINQLKPIYVDFNIPEQSLLAVRDAAAAGTPTVEATIPQHGERRAEGELAVINNQVDSSTGTVLLRALFPNQDEMLWPGQFVNVNLTLSTQHNAVVIPSTAIQLGQEGRFVCVIQPDDTVLFRPVDVGPTYNELSVVTTGLQTGERVVTSGQLRLNNGSKVKIVSREESAAPRATREVSAK
jgi:multidrug efflux system membrane fusion protein